MSVSVFQYDYINLSAQCSTGVQCYLCTYPIWQTFCPEEEAPAQLPPEEPIILKLGDERQLSFWPDSDLTLLKNWGAVQYYHGGGSLAQLCLEAARAAG